MLGTAGARAIVLPISAGSSLTSAWLIVQDVGAEQFGEIALVTTLTLLLPFADLGLSAPLVNAFATQRPDRLQVLAAVWTWLWLVAGSVTAAVAALQLGVGWGTLLDTDLDSRAVCAVLVMFALAIPFGVGQRILTGSGRVTLATSLQGLVPVLAVIVTATGFLLNWSTLYVLAPSAAQLVATLITFAVVTHQVDSRQAWRPTVDRGASIHLLQSGIPMLLISAGLAFALQSHRLVLSHWSTPDALAEYSLAMTVYAPAWALLAASGLQLWSHFAMARLDGTSRREFLACWRDVSAVSIVLALVVATLGPTFCRVVYGQSGPAGLWVGLGVLLLVQGLHLPAGMYLTDRGGLILQAATVLALVAVTTPTSIFLAAAWGAPGPVVAMGLGVGICQLLPCHIAVRHATSPRREQRKTVPDAKD